jgi:hypothetical protein
LYNCCLFLLSVSSITKKHVLFNTFMNWRSNMSLCSCKFIQLIYIHESSDRFRLMIFVRVSNFHWFNGLLAASIVHEHEKDVSCAQCLLTSAKVELMSGINVYEWARW